MQPSSETVLKLFEQISAIPRRSKNEAQLAAWLEKWAAERGYATARDAIGNLVIYVPAAPGCEQAPAVILQGHLDMVCQKVEGSTHDFERDPIRLVWDGDWLRADGTTLGADNGIGVAMALSIAEADSIQDGHPTPHPALELLFTVDEEVGLGGARELDPSMLSSRKLMNLDSEGDGVFVVGCAGGVTSIVRAQMACEPLPAPFCQYQLEIAGLSGGHSGGDIDKGRVSATRALAELLAQLQDAAGLRLVSLSGGSARNAIARQASAGLAFDPAKLPALTELAARFLDALNQAHAQTDTPATITWTAGPVPAQALSAASTRAVIGLINTLPHGVVAMSHQIEGLVESSSNLAILELNGGTLQVTTSQRSSNPSALDEMIAQIDATVAAIGGEVEHSERYPGWEPDMDTDLLRLCLQTYKDLTGSEASTMVIHAGLECGVIGAKIPDMEMVSFGAAMTGAHSPDEKVYLPSVKNNVAFLLETLKRLGQA